MTRLAHIVLMAFDAFNEGDHPRAGDGKFGSGGGGGGGKKGGRKSEERIKEHDYIIGKHERMAERERQAGNKKTAMAHLAAARMHGHARQAHLSGDPNAERYSIHSNDKSARLGVNGANVPTR